MINTSTSIFIIIPFFLSPSPSFQKKISCLMNLKFPRSLLDPTWTSRHYGTNLSSSTSVLPLQSSKSGACTSSLCDVYHWREIACTLVHAADQAGAALRHLRSQPQGSWSLPPGRLHVTSFLGGRAACTSVHAANQALWCSRRAQTPALSATELMVVTPWPSSRDFLPWGESRMHLGARR